MTNYFACRCGEIQVWTYRDRVPDIWCPKCGQGMQRAEALPQQARADEAHAVETMTERA